jgi:hypothetical protein
MIIGTGRKNNMKKQEITISLYEGTVPEFAAPEMERLYQSLYSSLAHHALYGSITEATNTYTASKNGGVTAVLLFVREGDRVRVLNEQMRIDAEEMNRFARHVFAAYEDVNIIVFHAVDACLQRLSHPRQHFHCTEDIVLSLPVSEQAYRAGLGKSTRSYINRYMNKLLRDFPDMQHEVLEAGQADDADVQAIIDMNTVRMHGKQRESYIDATETERILKMVRERGLISLIRIGGRICAGAINLHMGRNYFLKVIAHDPAYNEYRLGTLCCFLTICECIARGGAEYHFLWGRYEYKYRLLGVQRDLEHVAVYRSHAQMLRNSGMALQNAVHGCTWQARSWLLTKAREHQNFRSALKMTAHALHKLRVTHALPPSDARQPTEDRGTV